MWVDLTTAHGGKDVSAIDIVRLTSYGDEGNRSGRSSR
jgi:hypothetical protein